LNTGGSGVSWVVSGIAKGDKKSVTQPSGGKGNGGPKTEVVNPLGVRSAEIKLSEKTLLKKGNAPSRERGYELGNQAGWDVLSQKSTSRKQGKQVAP